MPAVSAQVFLKEDTEEDSKFIVDSPAIKNHVSFCIQLKSDDRKAAELVRSALINHPEASDNSFERCDADGKWLTVICTDKKTLNKLRQLVQKIAEDLFSLPLVRFYIRGVGGLCKPQLSQLMSNYGKVTEAIMFDNHRRSPNYGSSAIVSVLLKTPPAATIWYTSNGRRRALRLSIARPRSDDGRPNDQPPPAGQHGQPAPVHPLPAHGHPAQAQPAPIAPGPSAQSGHSDGKHNPLVPPGEDPPTTLPSQDSEPATPQLVDGLNEGFTPSGDTSPSASPAPKRLALSPSFRQRAAERRDITTLSPSSSSSSSSSSTSSSSFSPPLARLSPSPHISYLSAASLGHKRGHSQVSKHPPSSSGTLTSVDENDASHA